MFLSIGEIIVIRIFGVISDCILPAYIVLIATFIDFNCRLLLDTLESVATLEDVFVQFQMVVLVLSLLYSGAILNAVHFIKHYPVFFVYRGKSCFVAEPM